MYIRSSVSVSVTSTVLLPLPVFLVIKYVVQCSTLAYRILPCRREAETTAAVAAKNGLQLAITQRQEWDFNFFYEFKAVMTTISLQRVRHICTTCT